MPTKILVEFLRERPWLTVAALAASQAIVLYAVAANTALCCDSLGYYLPAGESFWREGLLWNDAHAGYRFYITPLVFGFFERVSRMLSPAHELVTTMPFLLSALFLITSTAASIFVLYRDGIHRWLRFAIPMLLNPLVLTLAPYPLQESIVVAGCLPLLFVLLAHRFESLIRQCVIAGLCVAIAIMTRPTLVWIAVPILTYVFLPTLSLRRWDRQATFGAIVVVAISVVMFVPQAYVHLARFHSLSPVPQTKVEELQIGYGVEMLEYGTLNDGPNFTSLAVYSPYRQLPAAEKCLSFYFAHPAEGLFLILVHSWAAFDVISFRPYIPRSDIAIVNVTLLFSTLVTVLGFLAIWRMVCDPHQRRLGLMLASTVLLNCLYVAVSATENRFGLLGFVALSLAAWQTLSQTEGRKLYVRAAPSIAAYVWLCLIINALLYYRAGVLWPAHAS